MAKLTYMNTTYGADHVLNPLLGDAGKLNLGITTGCILTFKLAKKIESNDSVDILVDYQDIVRRGKKTPSTFDVVAYNITFLLRSKGQIIETLTKDFKGNLDDLVIKVNAIILEVTLEKDDWYNKVKKVFGK